jgi:glycosyltransferase involved in cell wall biosynthesis
MKESCSLIIATYNWPSALQKCLDSVLMQTILPDEVIIADDGSGAETKLLVEHYKKLFPRPLLHIWQPDNGYQLAAIRNKAFAAAAGEYIIQIDGDLLLHKNFLEDHLLYRRKGTFIGGSRAMLDEQSSREILVSNQLDEITFLNKHVGKRYNALRLPVLTRLNYWIQRSNQNIHYVLGCNMAFWKEDLQKVNGYNEAFCGWGKEDNDLAVRLVNAGVELRFLKFGAIVYHLHHKSTERATLKENESLFLESIARKRTFVNAGMNRY